MEALEQFTKGCKMFDMVQNAIAVVRREKLVAMLIFLFRIFARGEVAQGAVDMFDSSLLIREEKTRHQFKSKAAHSAEEYIN